MNTGIKNVVKLFAMPKFLLVIDPVPTSRIQLAATLEAAQYEVSTVATPSEAAQAALVEPDLIILGIHGEAPAAAMAALARVGLDRDIPVLCLDSDVSPLRRLQTLRAGARDLLSRRLSDTLLKARLRSLLRENEVEREYQRRRVTASSFGFAEQVSPFETQARISYVLTENADQALPEILSKSLSHNIECLTLEKAICETTPGSEPDAYLVATGTSVDVLDSLLPELRVRIHSRHAPVLVLYPHALPETAIRALNLGASDIAPDNSSSDELSIRIEAMLARKRLRDTLRKSDEQSYRLAATDPLTGLYNRRYAEAYLADLLMRENDQGRGYVLMLIDLDHFKAVNDQHGHPVGDRVLCEVANRLRDNLRAGDLVARFGGEEFLVILPDTEADEGEKTAERLRDSIGCIPICLESGDALTVTASIGVVFGYEPPEQEPALRTGTDDILLPSKGVSLTRMIEAADAALYRAKASGRNRVEFSVA